MARGLGLVLIKRLSGIRTYYEQTLGFFCISMTVTDSAEPAFNELKNAVLTRMERSGALAEIKDSIRHEVTQAINKKHYGTQGESIANLMSTEEGQFTAHIVAEFLEFYGMKGALRSMLLETGLPVGCEFRQGLQSTFRLPDGDKALLINILTQGLGVSPSKSLSTASLKLAAFNLRNSVVSLKATEGEVSREDEREEEKRDNVSDRRSHDADLRTVDEDIMRIKRLTEKLCDESHTEAPSPTHADSNDRGFQPSARSPPYETHSPTFQPFLDVSQTFENSFEGSSSPAPEVFDSIYSRQEFYVDLGSHVADSSEIETFAHFEDID